MKEFKITYIDLATMFEGLKRSTVVVEAESKDDAVKVIQNEWSEYNACDYEITKVEEM